MLGRVRPIMVIVFFFPLLARDKTFEAFPVGVRPPLAIGNEFSSHVDSPFSRRPDFIDSPGPFPAAFMDHGRETSSPREGTAVE